MPENPSVLLVASLDTKQMEADFLKNCVEECGIRVMMLDYSIRKGIRNNVDISSEDISTAAGTTIEEVRNLGHEGKALAAMVEGAKICTKALFAKNELNGIIALGGSMGTTLATAIMRDLPFGLPKVMISTMAAGFAKPFVGTKDILMLPSVADLSGLNTITKSVLSNGAYALAGMAKNYKKVEYGNKPIIVMSTLGTLERCSKRVRSELENSGYEVIIFHTNGTGGSAMDDFIVHRNVAAVIELSSIEVSDFLFNGLYAGPAERCQAALKKGIPTFYAPGNLDFIVAGPMEDAQKRFPGKKYHAHNAAVTAVRTGSEELCAIAKHFGKLFKEFKCPTEIFVPLGGFSAHDSNEGHLYDPSMPPVFEKLLRENLPPETLITALPYHINDPEFALSLINSVENAIAGTKG